MNTCEEMLRDRGCVRVRRCEGDLCEAVIEGEAPTIQGWRADGGRIAVYVHAEDRIGVRFARAAIEREGARMEDGDAPCELTLVSVDGPTPFTKKECEARGVQFLLARSLCQNVTRHVLVPRHERVERCPDGVRREHLPRLLETDAVVQYYNWPVGTIVRIERSFGGNEPITYFRAVCASS